MSGPVQRLERRPTYRRGDLADGATTVGGGRHLRRRARHRTSSWIIGHPVLTSVLAAAATVLVVVGVATPLYHAFYDPDGRPRRLRRQHTF